eukprot:3579261-Pleurochrysis_carterae.AAC.1
MVGFYCMQQAQHQQQSILAGATNKEYERHALCAPHTRPPAGCPTGASGTARACAVLLHGSEGFPSSQDARYSVFIRYSDD